MQIFVKTLSGKTITIDFDGNTAETGRHLKDLIRRKMGLPLEIDFYLVHGRWRLPDNMIVFNFGVFDGTTVWMVLRLRGGAKADRVAKKQPKPEFLDLVLIILK